MEASKSQSRYRAVNPPHNDAAGYLAHGHAPQTRRSGAGLRYPVGAIMGYGWVVTGASGKYQHTSPGCATPKTRPEKGVLSRRRRNGPQPAREASATQPPKPGPCR